MSRSNTMMMCMCSLRRSLCLFPRAQNLAYKGSMQQGAEAIRSPAFFLWQPAAFTALIKPREELV